MYKLKSSGHIWTFSISNHCYIIGGILCVVQSCTRDPTEELQPKTRIGRSLIQHCACIFCKPVFYISIGYASTSDNKTHIPYDCMHITHQTTTYCQLCVGLREQSWLATRHVAVSFQLIGYAIIKII